MERGVSVRVATLSYFSRSRKCGRKPLWRLYRSSRNAFLGITADNCMSLMIIRSVHNHIFLTVYHSVLEEYIVMKKEIGKKDTPYGKEYGHFMQDIEISAEKEPKVGFF